MPALCRVPPPRRFRCTRAAAIVASSPARIVPNGAQRPLLRLKATVSTGAASSASGTPSAAAAFARRAPSRCDRGAVAASAAVAAASSTVPPSRVWVFSRQITSADPARSSPTGSRCAISVSQSASFARMCAFSIRAARPPGRVSASSATRLASEHVGTSTAACLPRSSAPRCSRAFTFSSSPRVAQPRRAARIASHISSVGAEQMSERRSIIPRAAGDGPAGPRCARRR